MSKVTADKIRQAIHLCDQLHGNAYFKCIENKLNQQLAEPQSWCNWELQGARAPVIADGKQRVLDFIREEQVFVSQDNNEPNELAPDLSRRGPWVIDPDNPLKCKPEGLRDEAIIAYWVSDTYDDTLQVAEIGNWKYITAFTVLEP